MKRLILYVLILVGLALSVSGSQLYPPPFTHSWGSLASYSQPLIASGTSLPNIASASIGDLFILTATSPTLFRLATNSWMMVGNPLSGGAGGIYLATTTLPLASDVADHTLVTLINPVASGVTQTWLQCPGATWTASLTWGTLYSPSLTSQDTSVGYSPAPALSYTHYIESDYWGAANGWRLFDSAVNVYQMGAASPLGYFEFDFGHPEAFVVATYSWYDDGLNAYGSGRISSWTLSASNDHVNFAVLHSVSNQAWTLDGNGRYYTYTVPNTTAYRYYRLTITSFKSGATTANFPYWELQWLGYWNMNRYSPGWLEIASSPAQIIGSGTVLPATATAIPGDLFVDTATPSAPQLYRFATSSWLLMNPATPSLNAIGSGITTIATTTLPAAVSVPSLALYAAYDPTASSSIDTWIAMPGASATTTIIATNVLNATMTVYNLPSPNLITSDIAANPAYKLFDGDLTEHDFGGAYSAPFAIAGYDFGAGNTATVTSVMWYDDGLSTYGNNRISSFTFDGSANGSTWTTLQAVSSYAWTIDGSGHWYTWNLSNTTGYRYYRVQVVKFRNNTGSGYAPFWEMRLQSSTATTSYATDWVKFASPASGVTTIATLPWNWGVSSCAFTITKGIITGFSHP